MKPILFNTEMVRAILADRKTVTRRVVKPQPYAVIQQENAPIWCGHFVSENGKVLVAKPPYLLGDILYVRETWCINNITPHDPEWNYKADYDCTVYPYCKWKWHPSIHMPRNAARIFLRVTDVRVERLQDITEEQAMCEGCQGEFTGTVESIGSGWEVTPVEEFSNIWDNTIKKSDCALYGWAANPWVGVLEFERITKEEALR